MNFDRQSKCTGITVFVLCLIACGGESRLQPLSQGAVILAFGDSLTIGKGVSTEDSYPAVLSTLTNRQVINAGVSGEVTANGLERLKETIERAAPSVMILMHGGNDILQNRSHTQAEQNLRAMIQLAQAQNVQVVLIGVPEKKLFSSTASFYNRLAEEFDLVFDDSIIATLIKKPAMKSDSVHFNKAGYRAIAQRVDKLLRNNGAL